MKKVFLSMSLIGLITGTFYAKPAFAGCNAFGCSQSQAAECNAFGCPNPPMGQPCTAFGCPASPQPTSVPKPILVNPNQSSGGSPEGISKCMQTLLYERKLVCTRDRCSSFPQEGFGG